MSRTCQWFFGSWHGWCPEPGTMWTQFPVPLCDEHRQKIIQRYEKQGVDAMMRKRAQDRDDEIDRIVSRKRAQADIDAAAKSERSLVYYVQRHDGAVKIGVTTNLPQRLAAFASVTPVTLLATMRGTRTAEQAMHRRFAADRIGGEWFNPSPALLAHIDLLQLRAAKREAA